MHSVHKLVADPLYFYTISNTLYLIVYCREISLQVKAVK